MIHSVEASAESARIALETVAMNFSDYDGAESFCRWWDEEGEFKFNKWAEKDEG